MNGLGTEYSIPAKKKETDKIIKMLKERKKFDNLLKILEKNELSKKNLIFI